MSEDSDLELQSALLVAKKSKKTPKSPSLETLSKNMDAKKLTTKEMINIALTDMKSRKGTSLYAIKKYMEVKFSVDVEKLNYIIKKSLKDSVQSGHIVQTKGIGASGSFKLASKEKKKTEKKDKPSKGTKSIKTKDENKKVVKKSKVTEKKETKIIDKKEKSKKGEEKVKNIRIVKIAKGMQTPSKKTAMMKRKSIGSIIKKPKMKPKKT